ncbi:DNA polymerase subunit Cdc27 [Mycena venus]|uniref:DNA polymerase delta subunit 3 n=1 Tax=Mycena venus TaxID=2733690 RepID=A0A8H6XQS4_9AGAR|nr:DNA polymerase subunit Cdc27 [Mycena venus]
MSTQPIRDYLTKQLLIEKNIVTYRSLSRVLALNVNVAKNELADFHSNDGQGLAATYLLSGQTQKRTDEDIDMDENPYEDEDEEEEELVPQTEIVLVGERELESAQAQFISLDSIHVYSLSPSVIRDSGLLCTPTEIVRNLDAKKGSELATAVGKVISAHVNMSNKPLPGWGGRKAPAPPVAGPSKAAAPPVKKEEEAKPKEKEKAKPEKPKATGKLDFSKAKTKPLKKEETKVPSRPPSVARTIGEKVQAKVDESKKRGTKRKSALASDSEEEEEVVAKPAKPVARADSSVRVRKGVVLSDDEDDAPQPTRKGKAKAAAAASAASEVEKEDLRAMMDIDDDAVTRASRDANPTPAPEDEDEDEDEPMDTVDDAKPAPVKRKPKKVVPVGKNGLKKKRVVKSRSRIDEKGYMVMEDYSEYESVDEEGGAACQGQGEGEGEECGHCPCETETCRETCPCACKGKAESEWWVGSGGGQGWDCELLWEEQVELFAMASYFVRI